MRQQPDDAIQSIAALGEPVRRRLYEYVSSQGRAVGRDEAARELGIGRPLAAFHLERLVQEGLLTPEFRRLSGRSGRGAGRPAKLYRRSPGEVAVTLPARRYAFAADLLATAVEHAEDGALDALRRTAREKGRVEGAAACQDQLAGGDTDTADTALRVLSTAGFEPHAADGSVTLANCPYSTLVTAHRDVICGMNLAFAEGLLEGLETHDLHARLAPADGRCCVVVERNGKAPAPEG